MDRKARSYKGAIVKEYCEKYPDMPTRTLARLIAAQNPLDFKSEEGARGIVRDVRHETCNYKRKPSYLDTKQLKRTEEQKRKHMGHQFKAPESDYEAVEPFFIPTGNNKILVLSDIHLPYHDISALEAAINYGIKTNVNAIYLNGDVMDCYAASKYVKDRRKRDMAGEIEMTRDFLSELKKTFDCPIYYKMGNHEDRWEHYLMTAAPVLLGIPEFELPNILKFGEFGVQEVKSKQVAYAGGLAILHGHELLGGAYSPVNTAKGLFNKAKVMSMVGHHHQVSEHSEKDLAGRIIYTWSVGCLCGLSPNYMPVNKWTHGFAYVVTDGKDFEVDNLTIANGRVR